MSEAGTLWTLFTASFLAATLLPGGSEAVLVAVLLHNANMLWPAVGAATLGNTLGGMSSYLLGRFLPNNRPGPKVGRGEDWVRRHGAPILLLSWVPVVGDALCVAAGWLRLHPVPVLVFMAVGKFARYWLLAIVIE